MATDPFTPRRLLGEWTLARRVADLRERRHGTVRGRLSLRVSGDGIDWIEQGVLCWDGARLPVTREYRLRESSDGWWLYFTDGRPFHPWLPGVWVQHPCRADHYSGLVDIARTDRWRTLWNVDGPGKQQRIISRFTRPPGPHPQRSQPGERPSP